MPIFEYKGKDYEVSDEHAKSFAQEYPDASIIMRRGGDEYRVKLNDYDSFISEMPTQTKDDTPDFRSYTSPQPKPEDTTAQSPTQPKQEAQEQPPVAMSAQMPVEQTAEPSATVKAPEDILLSGQLRRARTKLDELQAKRNQRASEVHDEATEFNNTKLTGLGRALIGGQMYVDMQRSDPEKNALDVAIRQTEELIKDLEEQQDRENGVDVGFWRGFGRVAGDVRSWDRGMSNAKDAITMLNADRLVDKNATEGERAAYNDMMEAIYNKEQAEQAYGGNASFWNRAGVMTGHMPSFMLDFAMTGAGFKGLNMLSTGATKAATKALGKEVVDEMAKQGFKTYVKNNGAKGFGQYAADWTIKALGTTGDDLLVRAPLMTNTVQAGSTVADIVDRKLGGVTVNEDGTYDFSNNKEWSSAIWQGEANSIIENYSEMFGSHLDPIVTFGNMSKLANVVGAKRLGSVLAKADAGALSGVMGQTQKLFNKMGVSDYFGEVAEEYYGQLWRTMLNLDDAYQQNPDGTRTNLLATEKWRGDIWGGMALSMGLMGAGKHTLTGAQYLSMKHGVNKADSRAAELLGKDVWEPLRQTIDQTTNDDIGSLAERIVSDPDFTNDELAAVFTYMERSLNMRGFNLGALAQKRGGEGNQNAQLMDEHYIDGYNINSPQEMTDAKNMYDMQRQRVADALGEDVLADIDRDPEAAIGKLGEDEPTNRTVIEYLNAKMVYDGMNKRVADDADARIAESDALVDAHTHKKTGMVQGAVMKENDRRVYIVNGNVVPLQDGTGIDLEASDNSIIIRDAETGNLEQVSPEVLLNVDAEIDPTAEKQAARDAIASEVRANAERMQNGVVGFAPGDVYTVLGEDGNTHQVEIVQDNGDHTVAANVDGEPVNVMTKEQIQNEVDAYNKQRVVLVADSAQGAEAAENAEAAKPNYELNAHITMQTPEGVVTGNINQAENDDNLIEVQVNKPFGGKKTVDMYTREELDNMVVEVADENGNVIWSKPAANVEEPANSAAPAEGTGEATALGRIPKDEKGEPMYESVDADTAWDALVELSKGNKETAKMIADSMVSQAEAVLKKKEKQPSLKGTPAQMAAAIDARNAELQAARASVEKWKEIAGVEEKRSQNEAVQETAPEIENLKPVELENAQEEGAEGVTEKEADALISLMKETADVAVERELTPEAWEEEFGEDGITETPVGPVKMGENQYLKLLKKKRGGYFGMIKPTLTNPDIVLEEVDEKEGAERQSKYLFVKTFVKPDGSRYVHFESVTVMKDSLEVSISSHEVNEDALKRKMQHDKMLHLDKRFLNSDGRLIEPPIEGSDLVPTPNIVSSADKGTDKSVTSEGTQEEVSENAQNATQSEQNELEKAEKERIDALVPDIENVADGMQTADEFVAGLFGNGIRITPESFRKETGLGREEQRRLVGIIAGKEKGGLTVEQAAETIVENYRAELAERGFSGDSMEMRDMVIDILSSGNPRAYAKQAAARRAEQALHREMEAFDRYTQEAYHMSAEEYIMYEESMLPKYIEQYKDFDEQEYYSNFADEQSTQNEHDTTRESAETGGSREILSEEQPSATPGEGTAGEGQQGGTLQGDVQGDAQERLARTEAGQEVAEQPTEKESRTRFSTSMFEDAERIAREEQRRAPLRRTARAWEKILGVKVTLMERLEDVKDPVARREIEAAEKKGSKKVPGWYSETEGVFLYLPHVENENEVDKTCVHEIVSHKGLKELLGQEKFDELCRKVWGIMSPAARKEYRNYPNVHNELQAADEYMAHLSENVELNARERSVWLKIMDFIAGLLGRKADNRSKAASIVGKETLSRKDIAELVRLSYAEYLQRNGSEEAINEDAPEASTIRSRTVEEINNEFNEQLQQQIDGTLPKGHIYQLGSPGSILRSTGIPNIPMQLNAARLDAKATSYGHDFDIKEIKDLVKALDNPVAVFAYGDKAKAQNIIVEIQHNGANFVVGLSIRPSVKGQVLDVNSIRNVFPKKNAEWLNWISQGKALYLDKEKIQTLIDQQRTNLADVEYLDLDSVAKIVENFENPKVSEENSRLRIVYHGSGAEFDKFNHAFMGTGEGNQAYGWGTYVTEVDEIGRGYAEASGNVPLYKGMSMEDTWAANLPNGDAVHHVMNMMVTHNLPFAEAAKKVHGIATKMGNKKLANDVSKLSAEDFTTKGRNLYSVDIPDDNGSNYLHWDRRGGTTLQERIGDGLAAIGFEMKPDMNHLAYAREGKNVVLNSNATGADWYAELSDALGGDKEASQFLNGIGIVGISYPAQARSGGRVDGARNYVIFNEADAEIVEHIRFRTLPNERLRKLDEGETCNIERVFTQQKMFNFSSGEKIESYEDVAYIFRSLEDEAVENAFVALVKNGKPTIVHLGMGTATQSTVDQQAVIVAVERIKPDAVYLVHNHPSGNLKASRQDAMLLDSMKKAYGDIVKDGIIINLRSGKYSVFNEEGRKIEEATPNAPEKVTAAKTYSFSKRVFDKDFNVEELMHVTGSDAADAYAREHGLVAALTSSQRLGERGKLSLLIISQGSKIVGNVFLNHTEVLPSNLGNISKEIAYYVSAMGGQAGILYGRFGINETRHLGGAVNRASAGSVRMLDAISMTEFGGYVSALDEGVMEETPSYGKGETRFRVSNDNQEIFVSNAQRAVEGIKQEKGTPQQWLAMIEKNGGLKAGEDKWMGLSDWLKGMDKKSVTKQEILDFIGENKIQIEEVTYGEEAGGYSEEKLDEFNAEYEELIWEGEEETGSIYANDWADYAYEAMADRYGDDFRNAFDTEGIGTGSRLVPHYYYDGSLSEEAKQFVGEEGANDNEINSTRLEYTTEGLDNKQEIALTVPTIEPWNQSDDLHFGDAGGGRAVAWIRFGEANDADGNAVLVIDEIQSKRHQEGREKGYNNPRVIQILDRMNEIQVDLYSPYGVPEEVHAEKKALQEELEAAFESENPQMKKVTEQIKEKEARLGELNREKAEKENDEKVEMLKLQDRQLETRNVREYDYYEQEINNIKEAQERRDDEIDELRSSIRNLNEEYSHYYNTELRNARTGVMPAPFEKNWHELAMKRMLRYAAENGFDKVAWTTGAQQAERYNMSKVVESIECNRVGKNGNKSFVLKGVDYNVISNNEGVVVAGPEEFKGKQLSEVVGVSLADKMLGMEEGGVLNNTDLRIGGEGMKGFYDKMLPSFVQKYTKKWGAKVGEVELPHLEEGAQKMWSVDVTPEMKESVMEGQTMFRVTDDIEDANARFNEELETLNEDNADRIILSLGRPSDILISAGVEDKPMKLYGNKVIKKMKKHGFSISELRNLPEAVADPIAVFDNLGREGNRSVLTELKTANGNFLVSLDLGKGEEIDFNIVSSVFGKGEDNIVDWIERGLSTYINKEKALNYLHHSALHAVALRSSRLDSAAKVIKDFQNPSVGGGIRFSISGDLQSEDGETISQEDVQASKLSYKDTITKALLKVAANHREDVEALRDAMNSFGERIKSLSRIMSKQKAYDKATVMHIAKLAHELIDSGVMGEYSARDVKTMLTTLYTTTGRRNIIRSANRLLDTLLNHQIKACEKILKRLVNTEDVKLNAAGVKVQGRLDVEGQRMMAAFRDGIRLDTESLAEKINEAQERMADSADDMTRREAEAAFYGLTLAKEYVENIKGSVAEEKGLHDIADDARKDYKEGRIAADARSQIVAETDAAIRNNKLERVDAYFALIANFGTGVRKSIERAREFREREIERVRAIQEDANRDMQGVDAGAFGKLTWLQRNLTNNPLVRFAMKPLATFDYMLRFFGKNSVGGEGFLWRRFMGQFSEASDKEWKNLKASYDILDAKVAEVFGKGMKWKNLFEMERNMPGATIEWWDGEKYSKFKLTQGNLLYIYMVDKMNDGRMKLRKMDIGENKVEEIKEHLDPRFVRLADWIQGEFLVSKWNEYNAVHERLFGASLDAIDNYFPLVINSRSRRVEKDIAQPEKGQTKPSTVTGAIIKRRRNAVALDLVNADAFGVVLSHLRDMEHWAAFSGLGKDLNSLLSYKRFRNQVMNSSSARYGAGDTLWNNFHDCCAIAAGSYRPRTNSDSIDRLAVNLSKGVTTSKIALRLYTAAKQFLSAPAFWTGVTPKSIMSAYAKPIKTWNWAIENLPGFAERWQGRTAGDYRLKESDMDWNWWSSTLADWLTKVGMTPNAFVDAVVVATGSKAVFDSSLEKYKKSGFSEDKAREKALLDAAVTYNETQQSGLGAYLSSMQVDRTVASVALTTFRNSTFAYTRKCMDSLSRLAYQVRHIRDGYKDETIRRTAVGMMKDGLTQEQAERAAKRYYRKETARDIANVVMFGFALNMLWELGQYLPYLVFGDDDEEKKDMAKNAAVIGALNATSGLTAGNIPGDLYRNYGKPSGYSTFQMGSMPILDDIQNTVKELPSDKVGAVSDMVNLLVAYGFGVNPQTVTDVVVAAVDASNGDMGVAKEIAFLLARMMSAPQSQLDKLYLDELGLNASEASKMEVEELAQRYADYKLNRRAPLNKLLYNDAEEKMAEDRYIRRFEREVKERVLRGGDEKANAVIDAYAESEEYEDTGLRVKTAKMLKEDGDNSKMKELSGTEEYKRYKSYEKYKSKASEYAGERKFNLLDSLKIKTAEKLDVRK